MRIDNFVQRLSKHHTQVDTAAEICITGGDFRPISGLEPPPAPPTFCRVIPKRDENAAVRNRRTSAADALAPERIAWCGCWRVARALVAASGAARDAGDGADAHDPGRSGTRRHRVARTSQGMCRTDIDAVVRRSHP